MAVPVYRSLGFFKNKDYYHSAIHTTKPLILYTMYEKYTMQLSSKEMHKFSHLLIASKSRSDMISPQSCLKMQLSNLAVLITFAKILFRCSAISDHGRTQRQFSLFSIVSFPDDLCLTNNGKTGTCLSIEKCGEKGGVNLGTCAKGFGVCCYSSVSACSSLVKTNTSYILSPNFPNAFNTPGTCTFYVHKANKNVCQLRLDFKQFVLRNPPNSGQCSTVDTMQVSTSGELTPIICGKNNNYHMYIDMGLEMEATSEITFILVGQLQNRYWEILVTQLACDDVTLAPGQCLQYLSGIAGVIENFNWQNSEAPYHLASQSYSICIRQESGFCSITYSPVEDSTQGSTGWALDQTRTCQASDSLCRGEIFCSTDYLIIPQAKSRPDYDLTFDRFCGKALNDGQAPTTDPAQNVPLTSSALPFVVHFKSDATNDGMDRGFRLSFRQNAC